MSGVLEIRTLGGLSITRDGEPVTAFATRKAEALLVYLACARRPCPREVLAELLWPDRPQRQSMANLRRTLVEVRGQVGPWICAPRETIGIDPASTCWLDLMELETLLAQVERTSDGGRFSGSSVQLLQAALALYRGDFLDGFHVDSYGFDDWSGLERERLRFSITYVLDLLVEQYVRQGATRAGLDCISRLTQIDPLREKTYRAAMRLLEQSGQREAALLQYETCQRTLQEELGVAPSQETVDLYERLRSGQAIIPPPRPDAVQRPKVNLPVQATSFVGRQAEVQELLDRLTDPDCRLLSVVGPGGIGKTRLALEAARRAAPAYSGGAVFVPLAAVRTAEAIVPAITTALAVPIPEGESDLRACLLDFLAGQTLLLVLDNLEHLLGDLSLIEAILAAAPQVKLLVTSRQTLNLSWEWLFLLGGMGVPPSLQASQPESYGAVRLFIERARRVQFTFSLADDPAGVIRICQLVEGMPLGIELAAAWLRVMSCQEIAQRLVELETPHQPVEERHRSLRALFDNTWQRLSAREQHWLVQLAVFHGGFTADAALAVAGVTLPNLAALVHKSLVQVDYRAHRYDIHQLLVQYMREKLSEQGSEEQTALDRHSAYYLDLLSARDADLRGSQPQDAQQAVQAEIDNVRAAWQHAVRQRQFEGVVRACPGLNLFYAQKVLHHEAVGVFQHALDALRDRPETPERDRHELVLQTNLIAPLTATIGWMRPEMGQVGERIRDLSRRLNDEPQLFASLILLAHVYANEDWERAYETAQEALRLGQRLGGAAEAAGHLLQEIIMTFTGRLARGLAHARQALALYTPENQTQVALLFSLDPPGCSLSHAGYTLCLLGYLDQGLQMIQAARDRVEALNQPFDVAFALAFIALSALAMRENEIALAAAQAVLDIGNEHNFKHWPPNAYGFRASAIIQRGDYEAGIDAMTHAVQTLRDFGLYHNMPLRLAELGYAYGMTGHVEQGLAEVEQGLAEIERIGERYWEPKIYRIQGDLLVLRGDLSAAEARFEQSIRIAQRQESRLQELQAALSLARLFQQQGRGSEARARLLPVVQWFTEGFDKPDLVEARALLAGSIPG